MAGRSHGTNPRFNRPTSAHSQGMPGLTAPVATLLRRLERPPRQLRRAAIAGWRIGTREVKDSGSPGGACVASYVCTTGSSRGRGAHTWETMYAPPEFNQRVR
jgi:hypothetical protein